MARLYASKRGKSGSTRPISKKPPSWCKYQPEEVESLIIKLAKQGNSASSIGLILRDNYGIPLIKPITGKRINEILKKSDLLPAIPEDLDALLRKASRLRKHLEKNRQDASNKRALTLIESKIHRMSDYYKNKGILSENWKYVPAVASVV
ncbi:30S ribosomal protein S15 [miscellaneous Crenarchaeota group archaeon SMTZ-80]|nr:MAG: 30S ribosomal protein S15 [miscellaneous Crenarchaeota group archaeon SMTZ-80]